ncbi:penicillin acylase family protein [Ideonella sp.]|uniref:penicillin acylase family protein n=1 Tax=Ideonella sp. TaxID=1929293 RepID=UPI002B4A9B33|nr:penicillin acylase family protein [Ideonella sp.]HJV69526.1 penicillin acylase family protein [Ideonella sp.]
MKRAFKLLALAVLGLLAIAAIALALMWHARLPQRDGALPLAGLKAPVQVRYDEAGVPHLRAEHEVDLYRALGYVHAQDRLFQMEILRRLARGELAEVLGPKLVDTDRLFRTLAIRQHADAYAAKLDPAAPSTQALEAYLDGINQFQADHPAPIEFMVLGIPKRPFTTADSVSVAGYLAYSFAAAFRTEPALTRVRDQLGPDYLRIFDLGWYAGGVAQGQPAASGATGTTGPAALNPGDRTDLDRLAALSQGALDLAGVPFFEGSNAWAISGARTASGKPLLAGDPHISFAVPAVWYEAHLSSPGFELYGLHQALNPFALVGHNQRFGWSLTMFQNDDLDLIAEKPNPANPNQVWVGGQWVDLQQRQETIQVKGGAPVTLTLRHSPHGPIVNDALDKSVGTKPIAMWWAFLETENPILDAFYRLDRADALPKAREAASLIHAPGLNVVWANAGGDIGWWAAAKLPLRPAGVDPSFVLDGASAEADKPGFLPFAQNPQEENPARGFIVSANHQPAASQPVPGYYNLWDRAQRLDQQLAARGSGWDAAAMQALQLDTQTGYGPRVLAPLLADLRAAATAPGEAALVEQLAAWRGDHPTDAVAPTLFNQFLFDLAREALADELGDEVYALLRRTRALDHALPRLAADATSPWWDRRSTPAVKETRAEVVAAAWRATVTQLKATLGGDPAGWTWGRAHRLTHEHPLGKQPPLDKVFNVGPFDAPGGRETPNNLSGPLAGVPVPITYGPSTRRVIDFAQPGAARGINPVGQSGVWGDRHYADQAAAYVRGESRPQHLDEADVASHVQSTLTLTPH